MMADLSLLGSDFVTSSVLAFIAGMTSVMVYIKIKSSSGEKHSFDNYHGDDTIVEAIVLEYTRRLKDYDKAIADLRVRLDVMEGRSQSYFTTSQQSQMLLPSQSHEQQQRQPHAAATSDNVAITQQQRQQDITTTIIPDTTTAFEDKHDSSNNNGTIDYILKLLMDKPRTSREIQHAIGRTREHTSRLMKKLHDYGLVSREVNSKPFKYTITDSGQKRLQEKIGAPVTSSELPSAV